MGPRISIEAGPPVSACRGVWLGAVGVMGPDVAAPRWWFWQPDRMPHSSDSLQERLLATCSLSADTDAREVNPWGEHAQPMDSAARCT